MSVINRAPVASVCDHVADPIDGAEHLIETLRGALELAAITFAEKRLHRVFDGKNLVD